MGYLVKGKLIMCRLFGFRSIINSQVHSSLVHTDNALSLQSVKHPDGWGVAYYRDGVPHVIKSIETAVDDLIFHKVSGVVSSQTVVAHLRKATQGNLSLLNSHPFQYGKWIFAHNGNLKNFDQYKTKLIEYIDPELRRFILGSTDSEVIFYLILSLLKKKGVLSQYAPKISEIKEVIQVICELITSHSGPLYGGNTNDPTQNHLTFILTSGEIMLAFQGGQNLNYSTYKSSCSENNTCSFYSPECEAPVDNFQPVNHLIFSSEDLQGENIWHPMKCGELVAVDKDMKFCKLQIDVEFTKD